MDGNRTVRRHAGRSEFVPEQFTDASVQLRVQRFNVFVHPVDVQVTPFSHVRFRVVLDLVRKICNANVLRRYIRVAVNAPGRPPSFRKSYIANVIIQRFKNAADCIGKRAL